MSSKSPKKSSANSPTGHIPRIEPTKRGAAEPPQPPNLPEFPDGDGGTTGFMPRVNIDGIDSAKEADDSAIHKQSERGSGSQSR